MQVQQLVYFPCRTVALDALFVDRHARARLSA
jgi:hypothetical protein